MICVEASGILGKMGSEGSDWVVMKTARAPSNIAVIKYWGKRDEKLILPINSSISVTLDYLFATTTVAASPSFTADRLWLNGKVGGRSATSCISFFVKCSGGAVGALPPGVRGRFRFIVGSLGVRI